VRLGRRVCKREKGIKREGTESHGKFATLGVSSTKIYTLTLTRGRFTNTSRFQVVEVILKSKLGETDLFRVSAKISGGLT
jgi:hypothetical protein